MLKMWEHHRRAPEDRPVLGTGGKGGVCRWAGTDRHPHSDSNSLGLKYHQRPQGTHATSSSTFPTPPTAPTGARPPPTRSYAHTCTHSWTPRAFTRTHTFSAPYRGSSTHSPTQPHIPAPRPQYPETSGQSPVRGHHGGTGAQIKGNTGLSSPRTWAPVPERV